MQHHYFIDVSVSGCCGYYNSSSTSGIGYSSKWVLGLTILYTNLFTAYQPHELNSPCHNKDKYTWQPKKKNSQRKQKKSFVSSDQRDIFSKVLLGPVMWLHNTNLQRAVNHVAASGVSIMGATDCMGIV